TIIVLLYEINFFFSSRRRHTRFSRDWSSDVCSSDLANAARSSKRGRLASGSRPAPTRVSPPWPRPPERPDQRSRNGLSSASSRTRPADLLVGPRAIPHEEELPIDTR